MPSSAKKGKNAAKKEILKQSKSQNKGSKKGKQSNKANAENRSEKSEALMTAEDVSGSRSLPSDASHLPFRC